MIIHINHLLATVADVRFYDRTKKIDLNKTISFIVPITNDVISVNWDEAKEIVPNENVLMKQSQKDIPFGDLPTASTNPKNYTGWERFYKDHIANNYYLEVFHSPALKQTSNPYETARDFKIRLAQLTREQRDEAVSKLKDKFARRIQTIQGRIQRAEERIDREKSQSSQQKLSTAISIGSTILGALFGRKTISTSTISKAGTAMKSAGKIMKESGDVDRAKENLTLLNEQLIELQDKLQDELNALEDQFDLSVEQLEVIKIRPTKTKISVKLFSFIWVPIGNETIERHS